MVRLIIVRYINRKVTKIISKVILLAHFCLDLKVVGNDQLLEILIFAFKSLYQKFSKKVKNTHGIKKA